MKGKRHDTTDAVKMMHDAEIPAVERGYGFSVEHPDWGAEFISCHVPYRVGYIELAVRTDESPPVLYLQRFDFREAATLVISAYRLAGSDAPSAAIVEAMRRLDAAYDRAALWKRVKEWEREFEMRRKSA